MPDKEEYYVGSFRYSNEEASKKALKEQNKIMKLESQLDYNNPQVVYSLYCKLVNSKLLETLEGITYLLHLQNYLYENESMLSGPIPAIDADMLEKSGIIKASIVNADNTVTEDANIKNEVNKEDASDQKNSIDNAEKENQNIEKDNNETDSKEKLTRSAVILQKQREEFIKRSKTDKLVYKIIIAFLVILIVVMLAIAFKSDSPNIINYRSTIQNEYADWENQLNQKEKELNERERELNK